MNSDMEAVRTQQTEKLIEEMLGFLESSTDEEISNDELEDDDEDAYESATDEQSDFNKEQLENPKQKRPNNSIAKEIKKIRNSFPIWNTREIALGANRFVDPIWRQPYGCVNKYDQINSENDWNSKLESNCRRNSSNSYVQEVNRAIYGDTSGHPLNGSPDYFQAAQNYAIYGKDFLDFPENLTPLLSEKATTTPVIETNSGPYSSGASNTPIGFGNGLYPIPTATAPHESSNVNFASFGKQLTTGGISTAAYYQMCNGLQAAVRPAGGSAAGAGSTAYGMFLGNKVTYVAAAPPSAPPLVYNQHSSTTTNFISNSLANAALASSPAILYSNPMLTTTTQQYLNTFFKETQYLSSGTTQSAVTGTTTGIYERLVYAQMLQQQIYHQTQQQAAAVAAMFQHKQRTRVNAVSASGGPPGNSGSSVATALSSACGITSALNLCGRQAPMTNTSSPTNDLIAKTGNSTAGTMPANSGVEDLVGVTVLPE